MSAGNGDDGCRAWEDPACLIETDALNMGDSGTALGKMGGMVILTKSGGFFGTEWDDQPIRPEDFRVMPEARKEPKSDGELKRVGTEEGKTDRGGQEQETEDAKLMGSLHNNVENAGEDERDIVDGNITEQSAGEGAMKSQDKSSQDMDTSRPEIHTQSIEGQEIEEYPRPPYGPVPGGPNRPPKPPRPPHQPGAGHPGRPVPPPPPRPPHMPGQARTSKPIGTPCDAFNDGELTDCRKITPEELCFLGRRACMLRNNRFLQYGYYNFGHLLLCRNTCGQWILGVPGGYDQQERFMANMFGFSYFKESPNIRIPKGKGGYWYRLIDAPNLNS